MTVRIRLLVLVGLLLGIHLNSNVALAVPASLPVVGALLTTAGVPAADGVYVANVALYPDAAAGLAVWKEGPLLVQVKLGQFSLLLGEKVELNAQVLAAAGQTPWLGVKIEPDPELPRVPVRSVAFALRAGVAEGLDCSGCIGESALDAKILQPYAKSADLAPYAKTANLAKVASSGSYADLLAAPDLSVYAQVAALASVATTGKYVDLLGAPDLSGYAKTQALAKVASSGSYKDLIDQPVLAKVGAACGSGLVVQAIKPDGTLDCIAVANKLKPDDISVVSNGIVSDTFTDAAVSSTTPNPIPDNNPAGTLDDIIVPDLGVAQKLSVSFDLTNSDISTIEVYLYDPNGVEYLLYSKSGKKGDGLKQTSPAPMALVKGDLSTWIGLNPKGKWRLRVVDSGFVSNLKDGQINTWSLQIGTLSSKKVSINGGLQLLAQAAPPLACSASNLGLMYVGTDKTLYICNGTDFYPISLVPQYGTVMLPGLTCKDILAKAPATKDGYYWIDPDGQGGLTPFQVYCDMTTTGGGWTRIDETTNYAYQNYCEVQCEKPYTYTLTDPQIAGIKAQSTEARQAWQCHTVGVGVAYLLRWWPMNTTATYAGCWATNNADEKQASGTETTFANLPQRSWFPEDNGDPGEAAQHNVDHAFFR